MTTPQWGQQPPQWGQQPPQWGPQPPQWAPPQRSPSQRKVLLVIAGVVALLVVIVAVVASLGRSGNSNQATGSGTRGAVTGTQDQWIESVCRTGTFVDGKGLPDANGRAMCLPKSGRGYIAIGQYDSDFKMRNALAQLGNKYYVSGIEPDGTVMVFAAGAPGDASILEPLTQFGFTINIAPQGGN